MSRSTQFSKMRMNSWLLFTAVGICGCVAVSLFAWIVAITSFGVTTLTDAGDRPAKIAAYNANAVLWRQDYRTKFNNMKPPTIVFGGKEINVVPNGEQIDELNDKMSSSEKLEDYSQLRLKSDNKIDFFSGPWNPNAVTSLTITTDRGDHQVSVPLMVNQQVQLTTKGASTRAKECKAMEGYLKDSTTCILFFKLTGICALVDSANGDLTQLQRDKDYGCFLKNAATRMINYDFSLGEYEQVPAGANEYAPKDVTAGSSGYLTIRDIRDPYVQLGYSTRDTFQFGASVAKQAATGLALIVVGLCPVILLVIACIVIGVVVCVAVIKKKQREGKNYALAPTEDDSKEQLLLQDSNAL